MHSVVKSLLVATALVCAALPAAAATKAPRKGASRQAESWTLGLNWYLTGNVRYTFNFERTVFDGDPDGARRAENALAFRTQISF